MKKLAGVMVVLAVGALACNQGPTAEPAATFIKKAPTPVAVAPAQPAPQPAAEVAPVANVAADVAPASKVEATQPAPASKVASKERPSTVLRRASKKAAVSSTL